MPHKRALVIGVVASGCVLLAGCGGASSSSSNSGSPAAGPMRTASGGSAAQPADGTSSTVGKLTGNFCTDFKNIGQNVKLPGDATGSPAALKQRGVKFLNQAAAYFNGLASEAPSQPGKELHIIAGEYQTLAGSIASGDISSLAKTEAQMVSLTTKGAAGSAFHKLMTYVTIDCMSA